EEVGESGPPPGLEAEADPVDRGHAEGRRGMVLGDHDREAVRELLHLHRDLPPGGGSRSGPGGHGEGQGQDSDQTAHRTSYHTRQGRFRTMGAPALQPNALPNSGMLETTPLTRYRPGEWTSVRARRCASSSAWVSHQICPQPRKNLCSAVKPSTRAGRRLP